MSLEDLTLRLAVTFITLLILARLMGRKELRQMTFFNFISAIAIGAIAGAIVTNQDLSLYNGTIALIVWSVFTLAFGFLDIKSKKARTLIEGDPIIVIKNGQIAESALKRTRLDIDALRAMLRKKNIFTMADVEYAIFEVDGTLSVVKKTDKHANDPLATEVVSDGQVNRRNLSMMNLDEQWLDAQLKKAGVTSVSDVFYAEVLPDGSLYIDEHDGQGG